MLVSLGFITALYLNQSFGVMLLVGILLIAIFDTLFIALKKAGFIEILVYEANQETINIHH